MQENTEISISDVTRFLVSNWKLYLSSLVLFIIVALGFIRFFPTYTASVALKYNIQNKPAGVSAETESLYDGHFDLIHWRSTQDKLSLLASEHVSLAKDPHPYLQEIATSGWLRQHVAPVKALSSDEAKELLGINAMIVGSNKPTEESNAVAYLGRAIKESTRISGLVVSITAANLKTAVEKAEFAGDFIDNAAGVLRYKDYIADLDQKLIDSTNKLAIETNQILETIKQNQDRQQELKQLQKEYPQAGGILIDGAFRQENAKYLPITNQLIALNIENHDLKSRLKELDELKKINQINQSFIELARTVVNKNFSYKQIYKDLLENEEQLRKKVTDTDFVMRQALDKIRYQIITVNKIASMQIVKSAAVIVKKPDYLKTATKAGFLGLAIGLLISILILGIQFVFKRGNGKSLNQT